MNTLTTSTRPMENKSLRPLPWRRMAWITWRQHRFALAGMAALLGAMAVGLWIVGLQLHHAYAAATACHPARSIACGDLISTFNGMDKLLTNGAVLQIVPALIGAFIGAPIMARELETGTFRYAWTQGFGRWRWTLAKLLPLAIAVTAAAGAMSLLLSWYYNPYFAAANETRAISEVSPFAPGLFDLRGVAFPAWALLAFAIGCLAGVLIRRVVPAIIATLVVYTGLALTTGLFLRQHYLTPLVSGKSNVPENAWTMSQWGTKGDKVVFRGRAPINLLERFCPPSAVGAGKPSTGTFSQCLSQHGYTLRTSYQPASRFWSFQWIEGGWLLALSLLLIGATVWLVHSQGGLKRPDRPVPGAGGSRRRHLFSRQHPNAPSGLPVVQLAEPDVKEKRWVAVLA